MRHKYKKFLKAAYIDYEEDYCSNAVLRSSRPPLSEILAPATFEITLSPGEGYYWTTFYTSMANYLAPEGVTVYKGHLEGGSITYSTVDDRIINKRQGVVIRSSTNTITLTKTYSRSSDDYSDNSLIGTDYLITNPGHAYALGYKDSDGVAFYRLSSTGKIKANKAYLIIEDIYLTQWRLVGNSEVHTDEYLTQWKVEGNSVVDNPSANLPQGYKKCKYLEFHGTEYINSGVLIKNDIGLSLDLSTTEQYKTMIGARGAGSIGVQFGFYYTESSIKKMFSAYGAGSRSYSIQTNIANGLVHHIVLDSQKAKIDNENIETNRGDEFPQVPLFIGTWNTNGTPDNRMFVGKMYSVRLYDSNGNLFNGIPCLDDNDVPCLYDTVSNTAFYNDGTGTFGYELEQPLIYSCGDYSDVDGKYHVKISNGVSIYDIPLTEPLRKVNDIADSIEFANGVATVTRLLKSVLIGNTTIVISSTSTPDIWRWMLRVDAKPSTANLLNAKYPYNSRTYYCSEGINVSSAGSIMIFDSAYTSVNDAQAFKAANADVEIIYELATPTTEIIQVSPFPISPTDTYSSANDTPYSTFEYKKNVEIWSCGEYSAVDGKYHIIVQPLGGSIVDIALDEPLRKVNDVADTIEFVDAVATVTRYIYYVADMSTLGFARYGGTSQQGKNLYRATLPINNADINDNDFLCTRYSYSPNTYHCEESAYLKFDGQTKLIIYDNVYNGEDNANALRLSLQGAELIYELATPTTKTIEVPQIQEADSYSCVISQGAKAVSWSDFETE